MSNGSKPILILGIIFLTLAALCFILPLLVAVPGWIAWAGAILLLLGAVFTGSGYYIMARDQREARLQASGVSGTARVLDWWIRGKSGGEMEQVESCGFNLEVSVQGKTPYVVKHTQLLPFAFYSRIDKGMSLPVKVDPQNARSLVLVWEQSVGTQVQEAAMAATIQELLRKAQQSAPQAPLEERQPQQEQAFTPDQNAASDLLRIAQQSAPQAALKERLVQLEEAYKAGLVSAEEYNRKRDEILKEF